jgi:hypothetical protein
MFKLIHGDEQHGGGTSIPTVLCNHGNVGWCSGKTLASHQYAVLGSFPGSGTVSELGLLLVLTRIRGFFPGYSGFPSSPKINM